MRINIKAVGQKIKKIGAFSRDGEIKWSLDVYPDTCVVAMLRQYRPTGEIALFNIHEIRIIALTLLNDTLSPQDDGSRLRRKKEVEFFSSVAEYMRELKSDIIILKFEIVTTMKKIILYLSAAAICFTIYVNWALNTGLVMGVSPKDNATGIVKVCVFLLFCLSCFLFWKGGFELMKYLEKNKRSK